MSLTPSEATIKIPRTRVRSQHLQFIGNDQPPSGDTIHHVASESNVILEILNRNAGPDATSADQGEKHCIVEDLDEIPTSTAIVQRSSHGNPLNFVKKRNLSLFHLPANSSVAHRKDLDIDYKQISELTGLQIIMERKQSNENVGDPDLEDKNDDGLLTLQKSKSCNGLPITAGSKTNQSSDSRSTNPIKLTLMEVDSRPKKDKKASKGSQSSTVFPFYNSKVEINSPYRIEQRESQNKKHEFDLDFEFKYAGFTKLNRHSKSSTPTGLASFSYFSAKREDTNIHKGNSSNAPNFKPEGLTRNSKFFQSFESAPDCGDLRASFERNEAQGTAQDANSRRDNNLSQTSNNAVNAELERLQNRVEFLNSKQNMLEAEVQELAAIINTLTAHNKALEEVITIAL